MLIQGICAYLHCREMLCKLTHVTVVLYFCRYGYAALFMIVWFGLVSMFLPVWFGYALATSHPPTLISFPKSPYLLFVLFVHAVFGVVGNLFFVFFFFIYILMLSSSLVVYNDCF